MTLYQSLIISTAAALTLGLSGTAFTYTCPTSFKQESDGFWYSQEKPGWKSHKSTSPGITIKTTDFGGVVYSPSRHRLACVYKASDNQWIALVSSMHEGIMIDKQVKDEKGNGLAWRYSEKHKDYACGKPLVSNIDGCPFTFEDKQEKSNQQNAKEFER